MRRSGSLVLVAFLAACERGGVEIVVYPSGAADAESVDDIRLYVGIGYGAEGLHGTRAFRPVRDRIGRIWLGDDDLPFDHIELARSDQPGRFVYMARGDGERLSVIAVGMTDGRPTSAVAKYDVDVPTDHVEVHSIGLNPASVADPNNSDNNQLELWGPTDGEQTCAHLIDTRSDHDNPSYPISMITTHGDADCDGFATYDKLECDDHFYKADLSPSTTNLSCLDASTIMVPGNPMLEVCRVGGLLCQDGTSSRDDCSVGHPYCAPETLCEHCPGSLGDKQFDECAVDPVATNQDGTLGHLSCILPTAMGANGETKICPHAITVYAPFMTAIGMPCMNATFHGPNKGDAWSNRIFVAGGEYRIGAATTAACAIAVSMVKVPDRVGDFPYGGLLAVDVTASRGAVMPIVFTLGDSAGAASCPAVGTLQYKVTCQPTGIPAGDSMHLCFENAPIGP